MRSGLLSAAMAWRYLRAPKSYSAVSAISIVAVTGVAIATAAIVCVLSVFNGFREKLGERLDSLSSDVVVTPAAGKVFSDGDSLAQVIARMPGVEIAMPGLTDNALLIANSREMPVTLKGVTPEMYAQLTAIDSLIFEGEPIRTAGEKDAAIAVGVAQRLGIYNAGEDLLMFAPKREGRINMANPMNSFISDSLETRAIFQSMQSQFDENTVVAEISRVRDLLEYDTQASEIEIKAAPGVSVGKLADQLRESLGPEYVVKDRLQQQEMNFRMVEIEKWVTFLLLVFILIIASFNMISTMCMLVIEKESSLSVLSSLGMERGRIGRIFFWESLYVSIGGGIAGIILGIILSLLQENYGLIKLNGDPSQLIMDAYPVVVEWIDILWALLPVVVIGLITSAIAFLFARSRSSKI